MSALGRERFCRNNANAIDESDGVTVCAVEGALRTFIFLFYITCFSTQAFEICRQVVFRAQPVRNKAGYVLFMVLFPLIVVIATLFTGSYGYGMNGNACTVVAIDSAPVLILQFIMLLLITVGMVCASAIAVKILALRFIMQEDAGISELAGVRLLAIALNFLVFSGLYLVSLIFARFFLWESYADMSASVLEYGRCAMDHFDGTEESYYSICGQLPFRQHSFAEHVIHVVWSQAGIGIFFVVVNAEGIKRVALKYLCTQHISPDPYGELPAESATTSAFKSAHVLEEFKDKADDDRFGSNLDSATGELGTYRFLKMTNISNSIPIPDSDVADL